MKRSFIILILFFCSCDSLGGDARFDAEIEGTGCLENFFPFEPGFYAARDRGGASGVFFQQKGGNIQDADLLFFEIFNRSNLESMKLEKVGGDAVSVIGQIELGESCPDQTFGYYLEGTLQFTELDTRNNGRVTGTLRDGLVRNSKTDEIVGTNLEGDFNFEVFAGQPFEEFTTN